MPYSVLRRAEIVIQNQLGKGSGAWSTASEAERMAEFVTKLRLESVVAIDAGASVGNWTSEFIKILPEAKVLAFEPSESAFKKLSTRFADQNRVECFNFALGEVASNSILYADSSGSGLGSLSNRRIEHFGINFQHQEQVRVKTLDQFLATNFPDLKPNVLKMDVEGHELNVLKGAKNSLLNFKLIQFEFGGSNIDTRTFFQDFWYFFKAANFEIYRLTPIGPRHLSSYSEQDETFRATNYIAAREK